MASIGLEDALVASDDWWAHHAQVRRSKRIGLLEVGPLHTALKVGFVRRRWSDPHLKVFAHFEVVGWVLRLAAT